MFWMKNKKVELVINIQKGVFMHINDTKITFDVEAYLTDRGVQRTKSAGTEFFAYCPFHIAKLGYESNPGAWSINTETGVHHCFSCGAGGGLGVLVKHVDRFDTIWDAEQWLIGRYGIFTESTLTESLELHFNDPEPTYDGIPETTLDRYRFRHPYLAGRGISDAWQTVFGVGYDKATHAITIPWRLGDGTLATVKKRSVATKRFWYDPPVPSGAKKRLVWGIDKIVGNVAAVKAVGITESETDALTVWQKLWQRFGVAGVAIGGNNPSREQLALLKRHVPADIEFIIMTDNNDAGRVAAHALTTGLADSHNVSAIDWSLAPTYTDVNELPSNVMDELYEKRIDAVGLLLRQL
jgi:DNA primase